LKRLTDLVVAGLGLLVFSPLLAAVALAILVRMGRPVLFRQVRPGLDGRPFTLYKFRTMTNQRGPDGRLLCDEARLGRLGRFLRTWSLDEIPQFWNVLQGDMSLVGPRPLLPRYLPRYSARQRRRHLVKPGITGLAQIHGRNSLHWNTRLELDVQYAEHASFWLDIAILLATLVHVVLRVGVRPRAGAELNEFWGIAGPPATGPGAYPAEENENEYVGRPWSQ
jgi:lipopolysaccharide/colanic/teichoic acid biosynthesis glycosyltransferase